MNERQSASRFRYPITVKKYTCKQECKLLINSSISRLIFRLFLLPNNQAIISSASRLIYRLFTIDPFIIFSSVD